MGHVFIDRTPSTSPPPAPPPEELMKEGQDADDGWIMVEDELLSIAQKYTQHMHHAEYVRLKQLAKTRSQSTMSATSRPFDPRTASRYVARQDRSRGIPETGTETSTKDLSSATREVDDLEKDRDDDPWVGTSLFGLMTSPRKAQRSLGRIRKSYSGTRAASDHTRKILFTDREKTSPMRKGKGIVAGNKKYNGEVAQSEIEDEADGDDDLEAPIRRSVDRRVFPNAHFKDQFVGTPASMETQDESDDIELDATSTIVPPRELSPSSPSTSRNLSSNHSGGVAHILRRRTPVESSRTHQVKRPKALLLGEIPTFLF